VTKRRPIGVVLAGGRGSRLGGAKATLDLAGGPLIAWPVAALEEALGEVVVVAKQGTKLPPGLPAAVWLEPDEPAHPRAGLVHALERAGGRAVLACAADMPLLTPGVVSELATAPSRGAPAVVAHAGGRLQPLLARYEPDALGPLRAAPPDEPLTATVEALGPRLLDVPEETSLNVNTRADLRRAAQELARKRRIFPGWGKK
jgi:molybdenum cofactor guanylyltransferase